MHVNWHEARAHCKRSNISRSAWFSDLAHIPDLCWTTVMIGCSPASLPCLAAAACKLRA